VDLARRATQAGILAVRHPSVMEQVISSSAGPTAALVAATLDAVFAKG
jgi:hypothetical protein